MRRLAPDVLALQEVDRRQVEELARDWHVAPHPRWAYAGVGAVPASRRPFGRIATDAFDMTDRVASRTE